MRQRRELIAPIDLGPPLEPLDKLIRRAEFEAGLQWHRDHGTRPFWSPFRLWAPGQIDDWHWLRRWVDNHLFELPPVGEMPHGQWLSGRLSR
jgi:hypothetical protein